VAGEAAHDGDRTVVELALDEVGGCRELVGDGDDRHLQRAAERVHPPGVVVEHGHPGCADGDVSHAQSPRPAHGVRDDHRDVRPRGRPERGTDAPRRGVGVLRQQDDIPGLDIAGIDAGSSHHEPVMRLHDARVAAWRLLGRDHARGLGTNRLVARHRSDRAPLRLGHHLAGDDDDVAI
jgi:hypothetical protein